MKIIISTENKAKVQAVESVLRPVWPDMEVIAEKFPSDVSEQPLSEKEGTLGALNRAKNARAAHPNADYCVGMEGYVDTNDYGMFLAGVVTIIDRDGKVGIGISAKMLLPDAMKKEIEGGRELGPLIKEMMSDENNNIRHFDGTNGILSKGLYNRVDEFTNATQCAMARFVSEEWYPEIKN